ncbi:MAG: hypothetical protein MMC23_007740 [Stictis urceolatum]|nr:hypothetical protein [Stictis urceolata]
MKSLTTLLPLAGTLPLTPALAYDTCHLDISQYKESTGYTYSASLLDNNGNMAPTLDVNNKRPTASSDASSPWVSITATESGFVGDVKFYFGIDYATETIMSGDDGPVLFSFGATIQPYPSNEQWGGWTFDEGRDWNQEGQG